MFGFIIVEVRDSEGIVGDATVDVASGPLTVAKASDGIYFGAGSHGDYTLRVSAPNYADLSKGVEIAGRWTEEIIHLTRQ